MFSAPAAAQSAVQVQPGQVCAQNRCVRFSRDLRSAGIYPRTPFSVANLNLAQNPVIPFATFREIYLTALTQPTNGPSD